MDIKISDPLCYSAIGQKPNQEDTLFPLEGMATAETCIFMVCDGMGGHENGEVASACVAETIGKIISALPACTIEDMKAVFDKALSQAYLNLDAIDTTESNKKMGTTLTFLALCTDGILTAHIGDSRIYQFRPGKGIVFQTCDHSLVNELLKAGELTEEEAKTFPQRNVITRAVQPHQEYPSKPTFNVLTDIQKGDIFLLCCDGVVEQLDNEDLMSIILSESSLRDKLSRIKKECVNRETRDNNTCYLFEVSDVKDTCLNTISVESRIPCNKKKEDAVMPVQEKGRNYKLIIVLFLLAFLSILLFAFFSAKGRKYSAENGPKDNTSVSIENDNQVQGTIQRHRNK